MPIYPSLLKTQRHVSHFQLRGIIQIYNLELEEYIHMQIDILTLFPEMFQGPFEASILKRAQEKGLLKVLIHQLRDWALDKHHITDDRPFGGGPGMVLKPEPIFAAVSDLKTKEPARTSAVILLTPQGEVLNQKIAQELAAYDQLLLICGRYEGVDHRVSDFLVDREISIGDYVLSGGELGAMVLADTVVRLLPGVLGSEESLDSESFNENLLDFPYYTQPADFQGMQVPEVLRSGDHGKIAVWRKEQSEKMTKERRPDLWIKYRDKIRA